MRERTLAMAHYSVIVLVALVSAACGPTLERDTGITPLVERRIFVDLPDTRTNTLTAAQKNEYDNGRRVVSHTRPRCVDTPDPKTHECKYTVDVQITAVEGAKYIEWSEAPRRSQLIAWIENLSPTQTTFDGLRPGSQARYALVVNSVMAEIDLVKRPQLRRVEFRNPARYRIVPPTFSARDTVYGHVYQCHNYRQPYLSDVDFRPCDRTRVSVVPGTALWKGEVLATSLLTFAASLSVDDPTWFSCASGCCTSANPY